MRRLTVVLVVLAGLVAGCGDDDGVAAEGESETPSSSADEAMPTCDELFGEGVTLREDAFDIACTTDRDPEGIYYSGNFEDCTDGRRLYWSDDIGWGYVGEPWHTDVDEPPADELTACG